MSHCIEVRNISKSYRVHRKEPGFWGSVRSLFRRNWEEKRALDSVSLDVPAGEILGLVGANGAGKTTLVKILAGIIHPSSGEARVLGYRPQDRDNRFRRQIALIMGQKAQLWWDLPAADCFMLLRDIYQIPHKEYRTQLTTLAEMLEIGDSLKIQIRRLSLGERMKMELIAALLHSPKVVFLDEPTIGLDLSAQKAIRRFLLQYRETHQPAMVLTSHYMEDIKSLCKRIVIIREGQFIYDGKLTQVSKDYGRYKTITADLEGSIPSTAQKVPSELGEQLETSERDILKVRVERSQVAAATSWILEQFAIKDLKVEEEEVDSIIESLQRGQRGQGTRT